MQSKPTKCVIKLLFVNRRRNDLHNPEIRIWESFLVDPYTGMISAETGARDQIRPPGRPILLLYDDQLWLSMEEGLDFSG